MVYYMIQIKNIRSVSQQEIRDAFIVFLFIFPMITRWLFPVTIEERFTILLFDYFPFYLIDACYLLFPFFAKFKKSTGHLQIGFYLLMLQFIVVLLNLFFVEYSDFRFVLWSNMSYFFAMLFILFYSFSKYQIRIASFCLSGAFVLLLMQIVLYSTGVLSYSLDLSNNEYAGVSRISTTIGAATGTSVIMFMLGGVAFRLFENTKMKYLVLLLWAVSVFLTVSRGASFAFILFILYFIYKELINSDEKERTIFQLILSFFLIGVILYVSGFITPLVERNNVLAGEDATTGRGDILKECIDVFISSPVWGVGIGNVYCTKELMVLPDFIRTHPLAPHNYYILTLIEQGIVGFLLFLSTMYFLLRKLPYLSCSLCAVLIITMLVLFNTEAIFVNSEFIFLFAFMLNICMYSAKNDSPLSIDRLAHC